MDEFKLRFATNIANKKFNVFKLHKDDHVTWSESKMRRENDSQPWQIKFGSGKTGRRFKAIREGGIGENSSYFVLYKSKDFSGTYEVCPVDEWYNMTATQRYKTLTAEEAEQKFEQRHKTLNYFSVMHLKKNGENVDDGLSGHDSKAFKVSEMDDWDESGDDFDDSGNENGGEDGEGKKKQRKKKNIKKEKDDPEDAPDEGKEDSDEGDFEQREVDYMSDTTSDSSASEGGERNQPDVKGIAEEEALRDLLSTDDDEEAENAQQKTTKFGTDPNALGTVSMKEDPYGNGSDDSSDSDDYDVDDDKMDSMFMKKDLPSQLVKLELKSESNETGQGPSPSISSPGGGSTSINQKQTSGANKRKAASDAIVSAPPQPPPKRPCPIEHQSSPAVGQEKVIEDLIKKYLGRKPMTLKNLLKDIKSKLKRLSGANSGMDNDLVSTIATIIKRLNPDRQKINDVTYFSLRSG